MPYEMIPKVGSAIYPNNSYGSHSSGTTSMNSQSSYSSAPMFPDASMDRCSSEGYNLPVIKDNSNHDIKEAGRLRSLRGGPPIADSEIAVPTPRSAFSHSTFNQKVDRYAPANHLEKIMSPHPCRTKSAPEPLPPIPSMSCSSSSSTSSLTEYEKRHNTQPLFPSHSFTEHKTRQKKDVSVSYYDEKFQQSPMLPPPPPPFPPPSRSRSSSHKSKQSDSPRKETRMQVPPIPQQLPTHNPTYPSLINNNFPDDASDLSSYASPSHIIPRNHYDKNICPQSSGLHFNGPSQDQASFEEQPVKSMLKRKITHHQGRDIQPIPEEMCESIPTVISAEEDSVGSHDEEAEALASQQRTRALDQIMSEMEELYEMRSNATNDEDAKFWDSQIKGLQRCIHQICEETALSAEKHGFTSFPPPKNKETPRRKERMETFDTIPTPVTQPPSPENPSGCFMLPHSLSSSSFTRSSTKNNSSSDTQTDNGSSKSKNLDRSNENIEANCSYREVKVRSPADLPAGHSFIAKTNGRSVLAVVPEGGVRKGEIFRTMYQQVEVSMGSSSSRCSSNIIDDSLSTNSTYQSSQRSVQHVRVKAPADLQEGYKFKAKFGDRVILAKVPRGGVRKGEIFAVPVVDDTDRRHRR